MSLGDWLDLTRTVAVKPFAVVRWLRPASARLAAARERFDVAGLAPRWRQLLSAVPLRSGALETAAKRALDVSASAAGLLTTAPVMGAAGLAIHATMGSPVVFRQQRAGRDGHPFMLLKFRTMQAPEPGREGPQHDAERLTRVGNFLRATSIDELPTLWNVLRGDMSLVGPRPLLMRYLDRYTPRQARRHEVKPGITGWAQIHGRNALSWEEKFDLDVWYVDHQSFWLDMKILLATVGKVMRRQGISQQGHATMPEFMGSPTQPQPAQEPSNG